MMNIRQPLQKLWQQFMNIQQLITLIGDKYSTNTSMADNEDALRLSTSLRKPKIYDRYKKWSHVILFLIITNKVLITSLNSCLR